MPVLFCHISFETPFFPSVSCTSQQTTDLQSRLSSQLNDQLTTHGKHDDRCTPTPTAEIVPFLHVMLDRGVDVNNGIFPRGGALQAALMGQPPAKNTAPDLPAPRYGL